MTVQERKLRVLVVDDDRNFVKGFLTLLEEEGFEGFGEYNGKSGIDTFKEKGFDAVFVDALLPGLDGFKLCGEIRWTDQGSKVPIVMISGVYRASSHARQAIDKYKVMDYLEKPISPGVIIQTLRKIFGRQYPRPEMSPLEEDSVLRKIINTYFIYDQNRTPLVGKLADVPLPILLNQFHVRKLTGQLLVSWGKAKKILLFDRGRPVSISSNIISECLGQIMMRQGILSKEIYEQSIALMKSTGRKQGEILMELGAITSLQLTESLKNQFDQKLFSIFAWNEATYSFKAHDELPPVLNTFDHHPYRIIRDGMLNMIAETQIDSWLKPYLTSSIHAGQDCEKIMQQGGFNLKETRFALVQEGNETLGDLLTLPMKTATEMKAFLMTLIAIQALLPDPPAVVEEEEDKPLFAKGQINPIKAHADMIFSSGADDSGASSAANAVSVNEIEDQTVKNTAESMPEEQKAFYLKLYEKKKELRGKNYFEIFDGDRKTAADDIKKAFVTMAKEFHPDVNPYQNVPEIKALVDEIFTLISKAHETLTNRTKRSEYLDYLSGGGNQDASAEVARILASEQHFHEAQMAGKRRDWTGAKQSLQEAIKLNPNEAEFYAELGWAHFNLSPRDMVGRQEAMRYLTKAVELNPRLANAYFYIGSIHKAGGDTSKAAENYLKVLEIDPRHIRAASEVRLLKMRKIEKMQDDKKKNLFSFSLFNKKDKE